MSSLRRRFAQNQEDVSYTIMALIPTLGEQILVELDVEGVTHELQTKSRAFRMPSHPLPPPSESSMASSIELIQDQDTRSDAESASVSSFSGQDDASNLGESSQSWVDQFSTQSSQPSFSRQPSSTSEAPADTRSPDIIVGPQLSDSVTTASSALSYGNGSGLVSQFKLIIPGVTNPMISHRPMVRARRPPVKVQGAKESYGGKLKCLVCT